MRKIDERKIDLLIEEGLAQYIFKPNIKELKNKYKNESPPDWLNIEKNKRVNTLSEEEVLKIREFIDQNYKVEGDLRREVSMNIKRLVDLATYRGSRHKKKLPVRGQRTHCNARTRKGKAIAIAGKKLTPIKK